MLESGAVPSQDGAGRGPDGEGLAAAPDEEPQSQHQLEAALLVSSLLTAGPRSQLGLRPPENDSLKQCRDCLKSHFECPPSVLCSPPVEM